MNIASKALQHQRYTAQHINQNKGIYNSGVDASRTLGTAHATIITVRGIDDELFAVSGDHSHKKEGEKDGRKKEGDVGKFGRRERTEANGRRDIQ